MNIVNELNKIAARNAEAELKEADIILDSVKAHLSDESEADKDMLQYFGTAESVKQAKNKHTVASNKLKGNILSREDIKSVCIRYGLRFLPAKQYVKEIPAKALNDLRKFKEGEQEFNSGLLYMIAPVSHFKLGPKPQKDPVLLYKSGNDYKIISQWGSDFNFMRRVYGFLNGRFSYVLPIGVILVSAAFSGFLFYKCIGMKPFNHFFVALVAFVLAVFAIISLIRLLSDEMDFETHHSRWNKSTL